MILKIKKNKEGSAIAYGLVIIAVVSILLVSAMQFVVSNVKYNANIEEREKAFHIAESGIYFYRWYLAHEIEGKNQDEIDALWSGGTLLGAGGVPYVKDYLANDNLTKIGEVEILITFPTPGNYNVVQINATGRTVKSPSIERSVQATLRRSIWSDFAVISDNLVCFDSYWTINGKVMGNNGVHFNGEANNIVMSGVTSYNDTNPLHTTYNNKPGVWTENADPSSVFRAGIRYPVAKKDFTGVTSYLQAMRSRAKAPNGTTLNNCTATGCFFDSAGEGRRIILKTNDTFDICTVDQYWDNNGANHHYPRRYKKNSGPGTCNDCSGDCVTNYSIPGPGVIYVEDNIWLEGQINGKRVSIAAANIADPTVTSNVFIMDNIEYTNYDGTDVMGILAEGDVEILKNTPNDLRIDGAILAQTGAVTKPEYNPQCCGSGCTENKNYIDIFGCVITKNGLNFALHKESCPALEENRTITYDNNLYLNPPPLFPADSFYYVDFWKEL